MKLGRLGITLARVVKPWLLMSAATAVAAVLLLLTLLAGRPVSNRQEAAPAAIDPSQFNPSFWPEHEIGPDPTGGMPAERVEEGQWVVDDGEKRTVLTWLRLNPRPQGVVDVERPTARIYFPDSRIVEIRADEGTFIAPDNDPRRGDLRGGVVVTLFEANDGVTVDPGNERHVELRLELEQAEFDRELGLISSQGPVKLSGRRLEFLGTGLSMHYNPLRGRVNRLEVFQGRSLVIKPASPMESTVVEARASTPEAGSARSSPTADSHRTEPGPGDRSRTGPVPYYRAVFEKDVQVRTVDGEVQMDGDQLEALFSFDSGQRQRSTRRGQASRKGQSRADLPLTAIQGQADAHRPGRGSKQGSGAGRLTRHDSATWGEEEVRVTWSGNLTVVPEAKRPPDLAGPDDVLLRLVGKPVHILTAKSEKIVAASVDYLSSSARVRAFSSPAHGLLVSAPALGVITGRELVIHELEGTGFVLGPGSLKGGQYTARKPVDDAASTGRNPTGVPEELQITWRDRVDLTFYLKGSVRPQAGLAGVDFRRGGRIDALRTADFHGGVEVTHPDFGLRGDHLAIRLSDQASGDQVLRTIDANGQVSVSVRSGQPEEQLSIHSEVLHISLDRDASGQLYPTELRAGGDVRAEQPGQVLWSQNLEVTMGPSDSNLDGTREGVPAHGVSVRRLVAIDQVEVELSAQDLRLRGRRLVGDAALNQVELFGDSAQWARVIQTDGTLSGQHMVFSQGSETVHIHGAGQFDTWAGTGRSGEDLTVTWLDSMHYDHPAGPARFFGQVRARTKKVDQATYLACEELTIEFEEDPVAGTEDHLSASVGPRADSILDRDGRGRRIRGATARGDVVFEAQRHLPHTPESPLTQFYLEGSVLTFDHALEQVQVPGGGKMLFVDDRAASVSEEAREGGAAAGRVKLSGRGKTLFEWEGQLTLSASSNDMQIEKGVQMVHLPADGSDHVQLDCQFLLADIEEGGGLGAWLSDDLPQPKINLIRAERAVRVIRGPSEITCDHLQYTAGDEKVHLWAADGRWIKVTKEGSPMPLRAGAVIWDLARDSFDIRQVRGGAVPVH